MSDDTNTDSAELEGDDAEDLKAPIVCKLSDGSYHYIARMILMKRC